jgi:hypothetical protein
VRIRSLLRSYQLGAITVYSLLPSVNGAAVSLVYRFLSPPPGLHFAYLH